MLAYLLTCRPRAVHKEELLEVLWPENDPDRAAHTLHVTVSDLRRVLSGDPEDRRVCPVVARVGEFYHLELGPSGWVDADRFLEEWQAAREAAVAAATETSLAHLRAAEKLYQGDFLADEPYASWALPTRERLRDAYVGVLKLLARHLAASGDLPGAIAETKKVLGMEPFLEANYRTLMGYLGQIADVGGVIRTYLGCRRAMREGLDGDVSPETRALATTLVGRPIDSVAQKFSGVMMSRASAGGHTRANVE